MATKKAGGSTRNGRDSEAQRLGVKRFGGQKVNEGEVLVRQTGATKLAGEGTYMSRNFTIHAKQDGVVKFKQIQKRKFTGKTERRTVVEVVAA